MSIQWKPIPGYEERYEVSNTGQVRSLMHRWGVRNQPKILAQRLDGKGYVQVRLYRDDGGKCYPKVHRLVANAFVDNPLDLDTVNHKDEVKTNNNHTNLEWMTAGDNVAYSCAKPYRFKGADGFIVEVYNLRKFCRDNKLTDSNMNKVFHGERDQHKGWRAA